MWGQSMKKTSASSLTQAVVIPAYEPPARFPETVRSLLAENRIVVVVDDGSGERYAPIFSELSALPGCTVLIREKNHGRGAALRMAFRYLANAFSDITVITADCDGRYRPQDILRLAEVSARHPDALCLGVRNFSEKNVPWRCRFGNFVISFLFRILAGIRLPDTQTGLRAFPSSLLPLLSDLPGNRYEYESTVLITLAKQGVPFRTVPIKAVHNAEEGDAPTSHFRPVRDSFRVLRSVTAGIRKFSRVSALAAALDVAAFVFLSRRLLTVFSGGVAFLLASIAARLLSSAFQYTAGKRYVFKDAGQNSVGRYYLLWFSALLLSSSFSFLLGIITENTKIATVGKTLFDLLLALFSFRIQDGYVFRSPRKKEKQPPRFTGLFFRCTRSAARLFLPKYRCDVKTPKGAVVYLCRRLHRKGPAIALRTLPFDTHPMVLSPFFSFRACYRWYKTCLPVRFRIPKFFASPLAFLFAAVVALLVRSARAIPAYRGGIDAVKTYRAAMECLGKGEPILIFSEDTSGEKESSDLCTGFLYLEKLYRKKYGASLSFVPLCICENSRTLHAAPACRFPLRSASFDEAARSVAAEISAALMPEHDR